MFEMSPYALPENKPGPKKDNVIFQPLIFRGARLAVSFSEAMYYASIK